MSCLIVIPARYESSRYPGKPLVEIRGKSMIERVYRQASLVPNAKVLVATDDSRIGDHLSEKDIPWIATSPTHISGTDRCAEVAKQWKKLPEIVINLQGDEPFINPEQISELVDMLDSPDVLIATQKRLIRNPADFTNPNIVKVICDKEGRAMYFSRAAIPYHRESSSHPPAYYAHVGLYGFKGKTLMELSTLPQGNLEKTEQLEQLRWMEAGYPIHVAETRFNSFGIDTPDDLKYLIENWSQFEFN